jgi:hypothetical protein
MSTNLEYRQYLIKNADLIIDNNQNVAAGNCSNIVPILPKESISSSPILYNSVITNPSPYDNNSDLKDNYLKNYIRIAGMSTPGIHY